MEAAAGPTPRSPPFLPRPFPTLYYVDAGTSSNAPCIRVVHEYSGLG